MLSADGVPRDFPRAGELHESLAKSGVPEPRAYVHNWPEHIASRELGEPRDPAVAVTHIKQAAAGRHGETAFNSDLVHDAGQGGPASEDKARHLC